MKLIGTVFLLFVFYSLFANDDICGDDIRISQHVAGNQVIRLAMTGTGTVNPCAHIFPTGSGTSSGSGHSSMDWPADDVPLTGSGCTDPNAHNFCPYALDESGDCIDCQDNIQNGDESGIDCGGILCLPCDLTDFDCDGVVDRFDLCPGVSDTFDINRDSLPDCFQYLENIRYDSSWYCGPDSIYICDNGVTDCISTDSLFGHLRQGGYAGPCTACIDSFTIAGSLKTRYGELISQAIVRIESNDSLHAREITTGLNGFYAFRDNPSDQNYRLSASKVDRYLNGVSTRDIVELYLIIVGNLRLSSPYWYLAADVNGDQTLSIADIHEIRGLILGKYDKFSNSESWLFFDANQTLADPHSPWPFLDEIMIIDFQGSRGQYDFVGVKVGDINGDANPNSRIRSDVRYDEQVSLEVDDAILNTGEIKKIDIRAAENIEMSGVQLQLHLSQLELLEVIPAILDIDESNYYVQSDRLSFSWTGEAEVINDGDVLFSLLVKAEQPTSISAAVYLEEAIAAEFYSVVDGIIESGTVALTYVSDQETGSLVVTQNQPNPFHDRTSVRFMTDASKMIDFSISDLSGRMLYSVQINAESGANEIIISAEQIPDHGMYYYTISDGEQSITKKMLKL